MHAARLTPSCPHACVHAAAGNPTEYYRKPGRGLSYGVGVKALGACRVEYARDCNSGTGTVLVNFGERY